MAALEAGKHVLVEKPLAETVDQARALTAAAERLGRVLLVDHTLVYSSAVRKLAELVQAGELGRIVHFDSTRINLGMFRDVNVIADLGVHDFAILDHLVAERPVAISATGSGHIQGVPESIANVSLFYASGTSAHVGLSWFSPIRHRQILLAGDRRMAVYNELDQEHPIRIHDKGVTLQDDDAQAPLKRLAYRSGDVLLPKVDQTGPLRVLCQHFVDCIANGHAPITDGRMGTRMVEMIDAATRSMHARGQPIHLDQTGTRE
jgi:predicted dehydrogenase